MFCASEVFISDLRNLESITCTTEWWPDPWGFFPPSLLPPPPPVFNEVDVPE